MGRKVNTSPYQFDYRKLRVRLYDHRLHTGEDREFFAALLGITVNALDMKLRGISPFTLPEIVMLRDTLKLSDEEVGRLFFTLLPKGQSVDILKMLE